MVCPNCKSDQIIQVQDQHFCINCGQQVPDPPPPKATAKSSAGVPVQENGLPEGVKILPVTPGAAKPTAAPVVATAEPKPAPEPAAAPAAVPVITHRSRIKPNTDESEESTATDATSASDPATKPKRRKPGRPKGGRLDVPRSIGMTAPAAVLPDAPSLSPAPAPVAAPEAPVPEAPKPAALAGPRRLSDISPRPVAPAVAAEPSGHKGKRAKKRASKAKTPHKPLLSLHLPEIHHRNVHKVGIPPLHFGAVMAFSLRARLRRRYFFLAALAALCFAAAAGYGAWIAYTGRLPQLSQLVAAQGQKLLIETALLAALYYIGRSISQAAITYGVIRDSDQRSVSLSRQFAVGINSFGRRLVLDIGFALSELALIALMVAVLFMGGESWPVNLQLQVAALFVAFLVLLYLQSGFAISRGLAGVAVTLTNESPAKAATLGWRLFSHRFELLGLRFVAIAMELGLALPLAAVAAALLASAPANLHMEAAIGIGLLAWVAGALFGAGTAAWWATLYRRIVLADHSDNAVSLMSGHQPRDPARAPLTLIASLTTLLLAAMLTVPWLKLG